MVKKVKANRAVQLVSLNTTLMPGEELVLDKLSARQEFEVGRALKMGLIKEVTVAVDKKKVEVTPSKKKSYTPEELSGKLKSEVVKIAEEEFLLDVDLKDKKEEIIAKIMKAQKE